MALANVACLLARRACGSQRVLMINWVFEAPGLHQFFRPWLTHAVKALAENRFKTSRTYRLLLECSDALRNAHDGGAVLDEEELETLLGHIDLERFIIKTDLPALSLLKAGQFDETY